MSNECYIKNKKKYGPKETLDLIQSELKSKFNLDSTVSYEDFENYSYLQVKIKRQVIGFYLNKDNRFAFSDTVDTAFFNGNSKAKNSYARNYWTYMGRGMTSYFSVYAYLHQYITNFLAAHMKVKIDSDGAGILTPFDNPSKYESYESWFKYWTEYYNKQSRVIKIFMTSPKKIKKQELDYFTELKF